MELLIIIPVLLAFSWLEYYLREKPDKSYEPSEHVLNRPKFPNRFTSTYTLSQSKPCTKPIPEFVDEPDWNTNKRYIFISAEEKQVYLHSSHWYNLRALALLRAGSKCEHCGSTDSLQCHHTSYEWLSEGGENELADLAILCSSCHQRIHDLLGYDRTTLYPINILK